MDFDFPGRSYSSMTYFSPPPLGSSTNTHHALRGGIMGGDYRGDSFDIRYMVRRELEKERIREEIIAEMARKQTLEDEVRREILMEKEFSSVPMMMHQQPYDRIVNHGVVDAVPFQRHPGAMVPQAPTGKLLLLPKPKDSDIPRIADSRARARPTKLPAVGVKNKAKELSCALCQVTATSEQALNDHIHGKKHKAKAAKLKKKLRINSKWGKKKKNQNRTGKEKKKS